MALTAAAAALLGSGSARAQGGAERILGTVLDAREGDIVLLDVGASDGVRERAVFDVYRPAHVVRLPMSKEIAYIREVVVAQVVVVEVDSKTATGRVVAVGGGTGGVPRVDKGAFVALNPYAPPINIAPYIKGFVATPPQTQFGREVLLRAQVSDEPHDLVYYEWSASGGVLSHARSSVPEAVWLPPLARGTFTVTLTAVDTAGNRTEAKVAIPSAGFAGVVRNVYQPVGVRGKHKDLIEDGVHDVAFDEENNAYLVSTSDDARIVRADGDWKKNMRTLEAKDRVTLGRAVARGGYLYAVDRYGVRGLKLAIGQKMLQDKPAAEYGGEGVGNGRFERPTDIAVDGSGRVYILDGSETRPAVHVFEDDGTFVAAIGTRGTKRGQFTRPVGIATSHRGELYVLDDGRKMVLVYENLLLKDEFPAGTSTDELRDVKVDRFSGRVAVLDGKSGQVRVFTPEGRPTPVRFGKRGEERAFGVWEEPQRLKFDHNGSLFLISKGGQRLHRLDVGRGVETGRLGVPLSGTGRIAAGPSGELAMLVEKEYLVANLDAYGWVKALIGSYGSGPGKFEQPTDVQVDSEGNICVVDRELARVQVFSPEGQLLRTLGKEGSSPRDFKSPFRLAVNPGRDLVGVLERRDQWNVKVFDMRGGLKCAFPGEDEYLEDALEMCITQGGRVHVAVDNSNGIRYFEIGRALARGGIIDSDDQNQFKGGDYRLGGIEEPGRLLVTNLAFLFAVKTGSYVQVINLQNNSPLTQIKDPARLRDPRDVAVDDYDRVYVWDADSEQVVVFAR